MTINRRDSAENFQFRNSPNGGNNNILKVWRARQLHNDNYSISLLRVFFILLMNSLIMNTYLASHKRKKILNVDTF